MSFSTALRGMVPHLQSAAPFMALAAFLIALLAVAIALEVRSKLQRLELNHSGTLDSSVAGLLKEMREVQGFRKELEEYLRMAELRLQHGLRGVGIVRFNPFEGDGSGGNQSFAIALIDERGDGVVICAIYTRSGQTSLYAKPIEKGASPFELTEEERAALQKATASMRQIKQERDTSKKT